VSGICKLRYHSREEEGKRYCEGAEHDLLAIILAPVELSSSAVCHLCHFNVKSGMEVMEDGHLKVA
jgi:hypothetical protein